MLHADMANRMTVAGAGGFSLREQGAYFPQESGYAEGHRGYRSALHPNASPVTRIRSSATNLGDAAKEYIGMSVKPQRKRLARRALGATVVGAPARIAAESGIPVGASRQTDPTALVAESGPGYAVRVFTYPQADKICSSRSGPPSSHSKNSAGIPAAGVPYWSPCP